jgi:hypothetical protein
MFGNSMRPANRAAFVEAARGIDADEVRHECHRLLRAVAAVKLDRCQNSETAIAHRFRIRK